MRETPIFDRIKLWLHVWTDDYKTTDYSMKIILNTFKQLININYIIILVRKDMTIIYIHRGCAVSRILLF